MVTPDIHQKPHSEFHWMDLIRDFDTELYLHSVAVAELTGRFAAHLGFSIADQQCLTTGALLHDLGKIGLPLAVLNQPRSLTESEKRLIRSHADIGYEMLRQDGEGDETLLSIVRDHHERLDGTGYPRKLCGEEISLAVRVVVLCDVFTAMTEARPYARPLDSTEALDRMCAKKSRLDQALLHEFHTMVRSDIVGMKEFGA